MNIITILFIKIPTYNKFIHLNEVRKMIDYSPLWNTMQEKNISQYKLIENGIDRKTLDSLRKNKNITALTIEKLCKVLDCTPNDILEFHD